MAECGIWYKVEKDGSQLNFYCKGIYSKSSKSFREKTSTMIDVFYWSLKVAVGKACCLLVRFKLQRSFISKLAVCMHRFLFAPFRSTMQDHIYACTLLLYVAHTIIAPLGC